jgi:hypothetical protein
MFTPMAGRKIPPTTPEHRLKRETEPKCQERRNVWRVLTCFRMPPVAMETANASLDSATAIAVILINFISIFKTSLMEMEI